MNKQSWLHKMVASVVSSMALFLQVALPGVALPPGAPAQAIGTLAALRETAVTFANLPDALTHPLSIACTISIPGRR